MTADTRKFILALAIFSTTGIGVFALPYAFSHSGSVSFAYFALLAPAVLFVEYLFSKIVLQIKTRVHSIPGYVNNFLGKKWRNIAMANAIFGFEGVLLSYIAASGLFLSLVIPHFSILALSVIFALVGFLLIFFDIRSVARSELFITISLIVLFFTLSFMGLGRFDSKIFFSNLANPNSPFLAYGVILFALSGFASVPIIREEIGENESHLTTIIFIGSLIIWSIYLTYAVATLGLGLMPPKESISLYGLAFGLGAKIAGAVLGLLSISASFLIGGLYLKNAFRFDYGLSKIKSFLLVSVPTLVLFLLGLHNFVPIIGFLGAVAVAIDASFILWLYWCVFKPKGITKFSITLLWLIFLAGAASEIYFVILK